MTSTVSEIRLAPDSKIWIFAPDRKFSPQEINRFREKIKAFAYEWVSHGNPLSAQGELLYDYFLVMIVDNSVYQASGCSVDSLFRFVQTIGQEMKTDFLNRMVFQYLDTQNQLQLIRQDQLKEALSTGQISLKTLFFDNTVETLESLKGNWIKPLESFWLKRLI